MKLIMDPYGPKVVVYVKGLTTPENPLGQSIVTTKML